MDHEYQSSYILLLKSFMFVTKPCTRNLSKKATNVHRHTTKIYKIKGLVFKLHWPQQNLHFNSCSFNYREQVFSNSYLGQD